MNQSGKIILIVFALLVLTVVGFKYKQFFLDKDYSFQTQVSCDPKTESCFKVICDGESATSTGECDTSSGVMFTDGSPYKYIELPETDVPSCLEGNTCPDFFCPADNPDCVTTYCSEDVLEDGEECVATTTPES